MSQPRRSVSMRERLQAGWLIAALLAIAAIAAACTTDDDGDETPAGGSATPFGTGTVQASPTSPSVGTSTPGASPTSGATGTAQSSPTSGSTPTPQASPTVTSPAASPTPSSSPTGTAGTVTPGAADVAVFSSPVFGEVLVADGERPLYVFDNDTGGQPSCTGACAEIWPPFTIQTGQPVAGQGVTAELGTIVRQDGSTQVTAGGRPLYFFAEDTEPGVFNGQGVNGRWWLVGPDGRAVTDMQAIGTPTPAPSGTPGISVPGGAGSGAANLHTELNVLLQERVYLTAAATGAFLAGEQNRSLAAQDALNDNAAALGTTIGSLYGPFAQIAVSELWRQHMDLMLAYAQAASTGDTGTQQQAKDGLRQLATNLDAVLSATDSGLPPGEISGRLNEHIDSMTAVIDAQAAQSPEVYTLLHEAAQQTGEVADLLAQAIIRQFPDRFG